ncbi:FecR family protein [Puia dinghuensis]|uniref:Anti-sigma factor n=1 Tax=Puia dinghuensis TaxID=1792502 RepID=A0A8J2XW33_9BACT|nr:FecR domain-containing protein [Puia dinghuensis]GGB16364.1 anti-sigma factor [Puia dinghuensis]
MDEVTKNNKDEFPFGFRHRPVSDELREKNWKAVEEAIRQSEGMPVDESWRTGRRVVRLVRVFAAAASLIAFAFGIWWIGTRTGHPQYAKQMTGFGEMKTIVLPDSSVVILNSNSSLTIPEQWTEAADRQVWLEGEAYFQVKKQPATVKKFVVHTRQVDVEVLGTRFNVNTRRQQAVVSLEEGKVRLSVLSAGATVVGQKTSMVMRPGQVAVVNSAQQTTLNEEKAVTTHSGWTRHEFHFDNTSLEEVAHIVEDTYGYKMEMEDSATMSQYKVSGDVRVQNVEEMTRVLAASSGYAMRIKDKTIYVTFH